MKQPDLTRLRILAMLPPHGEERTEYLVNVLAAARARWDWQVDIICTASNKEDFRPLVEPSGRVFVNRGYTKTADWESDPERVAQVEANLRDAELTTGVPVGQFLLASPASIGCAFMLPHMKVKPSELSNRVLSDNTEPYRIYRRMFGFAEQLLQESNPDLFLAYEWEKPWRSAIWMAAARRRTPCVAIRRSKLNGDHYFWTTDRTFFNVAANEVALRKRQTNAAVSEAAHKKIEEFRNRPATVKYIREKWDLHGKKTWWTWHKDWARKAVKQSAAAAIGRGGRGNQILGQLVEHNRRFIRGSRERKFFAYFDDAALASMKYVYFPMHKETDLPLVFQAPRWHDQANTLRILAGALPYGYRLLAREHRFNVGRRPAHYYEYLSQLPNLVLIDPFGDQFSYIRNADLVVTENGSSGWEGLLFNRPVITLSRTAYDAAGLARKVTNSDEIGTVILDAVAGPPIVDRDEYQRRLGLMMDAEFETTFSMKVDRAGEGVERLEALLSTILLRQADGNELSKPERVDQRIAS
jgi:hypothetical protein